MSRQTVTFTAETVKIFRANPKQIAGYGATIQNLTDQSINITVTNGDVQNETPDYDTPAAGALTIASGAVGLLKEAYQAWTLTAAGAATGTVRITELG